jgi:hypothetical protein
MMDNVAQQPDRITSEMRQFTDEFEKALGIMRDKVIGQ